MTKISELRNLTGEELQQKMDSLRKELFDLRYQIKTGRIEKPHMVGRAKRDIARCQTLLNEHKSQAGNKVEVKG